MRIVCHSRKTSCQLDTHLNDATPRQKERDRHEPEEQWTQPPTLHHPSGGKSQHAKEPAAEQQAASVPGAVEEGNDEETKGETNCVAGFRWRS